MAVHRSDSLAQRDAEPLIRARLAEILGVPPTPRSFELRIGSRDGVDGVGANGEGVREELRASGRLKGARFHNVAPDAAKLITLTKDLAGVRRILAFGDAEAAAYVRGRSWLSEALASWKVDVVVVDLNQTVRDALRAGRVRRMMINAPEA